MYKEEFPLLRDRTIAYLDSAATTQKPSLVIERLEAFYRQENANVHRALYPLGDMATALYEDSRSRVKKFLGALSGKEVIFTYGATDSLNLLADSFCRTLSPGDHILLTEMEHHSNLVPWQLAAEKNSLKLDFIPLGEDGRLDLDHMRAHWHKKIRLVSLTHISNLLGTVNPLEEVIEFAHARGVPVAVDGAQSAARVPVDVGSLDCDFFVFSGHKVYGPTGVGILYGKSHLMERLPPFRGGGNMINSVSLEGSSWAELPERLEAGTPPIAQAIGLGAALEWLENRGRREAAGHEAEMTGYMLEKLQGIEGIEIYGTKEEDQLGVVSFNLTGLHAHDTVQFLAAENLCLRAGHHCAQPLIRKLGIASAVRASLGVYSDREDVDRLAEALESTRLFFKEKGVL